jgi:DnaJ-class molecular chaperone
MDLKREDLIRTCERCKGTGMFTETTSGSHYSHTRSETCGDCGGRGYILTPAGHVLAQFIREIR